MNHCHEHRRQLKFKAKQRLCSPAIAFKSCVDFCSRSPVGQFKSAPRTGIRLLLSGKESEGLSQVLTKLLRALVNLLPALRMLFVVFIFAFVAAIIVVNGFVPASHYHRWNPLASQLCIAKRAKKSSMETGSGSAAKKKVSAQPTTVNSSGTARTTSHEVGSVQRERDTKEKEARIEALSGVVSQIERSYGKGSIQKLGESPSVNVATFPSGSVTLDMAMGGGYPRGRVIEIYGPESSGKTTLALHAVAEMQRLGGTAAFIDAEHAMDPIYARNLGVNVDELLLCQPDSGEMALDVVDQLVRSAAVDIVVVDSVAALVPRAELEGDMGEQQMGLQARLMSKALRKITGSLSKSHTTVLFLNQLRSKIGIMYGNPEVTAGGNALKFYSSVRVDIRRREVLKDNQGITVKVKVVKNKVAPPFRQVEFDILFGSGIDKLGCLLDAADQFGVVERKGSWYSRGDLRFAQGRRPAIDFLRTNEGIAREVDAEVRKAIAFKAASSSSLPHEADGDDPGEDLGAREFGGGEEEYVA